MMESEKFRQVLYRWAILFETSRPDIPISGSPERTEFRMVVEDIEGGHWLLEKVPLRLKRCKLEIIRLLSHLARENFEYVLPYRSTEEGVHLVADEDGFWQLLPFVDGVSLDRPRYVFDAWRGLQIARCLFSLRQTSAGFHVPGSRDFFSITDYVTDMAEKISRHNPELTSPLSPVLTYLERSFFHVHDTLPTAFCHGDFHPLNIIWTSESITALIDWEFFGLKPEAYDVANMLGCLGMETPEGLSGGMALAFLDELKSHNFLSPVSLHSLLDLTLAIRFAWLSEWLRKHDTQMIELELTYMYLLMDNRDKINKVWGI